MEIRLVETFDDSEVVQKLNALTGTLKQLDNDAQALGKDLSASLGAGADAATGLTESLATANDELARQGKSIDTATKLNQSWFASLKNTIAGQQLAGKTVGEWALQFKNLFVAQTAAASGTEKVSLATRVFNGILKASPIFLIVGVLASVILYLGKFDTITRLVSGTMAALNAAVDALVTKMLEYEEGVLKIIRGDFVEGFKQMFNATTSVAGAMYDAAQNAIELDRQLAALQDRQIKTASGFARMTQEIERLKKISEDETLSRGAQMQAALDALEIQRRLNGERLDQERQLFQLTVDKYNIEQRKLEELIRTDADAAKIREQQAAARLEKESLSLDKKKEISEAEIRLIEAEKSGDQAILDLQQRIREIREAAAKARAKQLEDERKLLEQIEKDLERLRAAAQPAGIERDLAEVDKKYNALIAKAREGVEAFNKIERRRGLTPEELAKRKELEELQVKLTTRSLEATLDVLTEYAEREFELDQQVANAKKRLSERELADLKKALEVQRDLGQKNIEFEKVQGEGLIKQLAASGASKLELQQAQADLSEAIREKELKNLIAYNQRLLEVETDPAAVSKIIADLKVLQGELANLDIDTKPRRKFDFWALLGLDGKSDAQGAVKDGVGLFVDGLSQVIKAREEAAQRAREIAEQELADAQKNYEDQLELAQKGSASNLQVALDEVAKKKKAREDALRDERKAQRAQLILDSATQASSLITSSANIFKALSPIQPFGTALAVGLITAMLAAFVAAKAKAFAAIGKEKLRTGKRIVGRTHEQGGEDHLGLDGKVYETENLEWVVGTQPSKEHDRFIGRMNSGAYRGVDLVSVVERGMQKGDYASPIGEAAPRIEVARMLDIRSELEHRERVMARAYRESAREVVEAIERQPLVLPLSGGYVLQVKEGNTVIRKIVEP